MSTRRRLFALLALLAGVPAFWPQPAQATFIAEADELARAKAADLATTLQVIEGLANANDPGYAADYLTRQAHFARAAAADRAHAGVTYYVAAGALAALALAIAVTAPGLLTLLVPLVLGSLAALLTWRGSMKRKLAVRLRELAGRAEGTILELRQVPHPPLLPARAPQVVHLDDPSGLEVGRAAATAFAGGRPVIVDGTLYLQDAEGPVGQGR